MSRYIDADALIVNMRGAFIDHVEEFRAITIIKDAPSIDIVRCVECRKCKEQGGHANCGGYLYCTRQKTMVDEDCFCAWGEER